MNDNQYLEIILQGWREDIGGTLTNHFYREWKKAEKNNYTFGEFFSGLIRLQKALTADIDRRKIERMNEVAIIKGIWEREGKDIKELEGQAEIQYSVNLWHLTNDPKYIGLNLWQSDIDYIGGQIINAYERINKESGVYCYNDFEELFDDLIYYKDLPMPLNSLNKSADSSLHKFYFDNFLYKMKNIDENKYKECLTRNLFNEYLDHFKKGNLTESDGNIPGNKNIKTGGKIVLEFNSLKEIFISIEVFNVIMNKLVDEELIDKNSFEWMDRGPGFKSRIAALLYHLYHNKYFRCTELPGPEQIKMLAENGFKVNIGIRTIKDKKVNDFRKDFAFIKQFQP